MRRGKPSALLCSTVVLAALLGGCPSGGPGASCADVDCSGVGTCVVFGNAAHCVCPSGLAPLGTSCLPAAPLAPAGGGASCSERTCSEDFLVDGDGSELERLAECTAVDGEVAFTGPAVTALSGLGCLQELSADLSVGDTALAGLAGLDALTAVGGSLRITGNPVLGQLAGLEALRLVGGDLTVAMNPVLRHVGELGGVTGTVERVNVTDNASLRSVDGLGSLTAVEQQLVIGFNDALTDLDGLSALESTGWFLLIAYNPSLENVDGLAALTTVGGDVTIRGNAALTDLSGLSALAHVGGNLRIVDNAALPTCEAEELAARLAAGGWTGSVLISGNDDEAVCR